jgi:hypothetical protein
VVNGINGGVNGINGHSRTISDSTSFDDDDFDIELDNGRDMDLSYEAPVARALLPADAPAQNARNPSFAERDAQSARASGLIGNMLLRGFSLLADSCPNSTCYGIPLVGHPRARRTGGRDAGLEEQKKECVICHRVYNKDGALLQGGSAERVAAAQVRATATDGDSQPDSPRTIARRALYTQGEKIQAQAKNVEALSEPAASRPQPAPAKSVPGPTTSKVRVVMPILLLDIVAYTASPQKQESSNAHAAVNETIEVLVSTLSKLNTELRTMLEHPDVRRTIKDKGMKRCLNRIRDTMETLTAAEELQLKLQK